MAGFSGVARPSGLYSVWQAGDDSLRGGSLFGGASSVFADANGPTTVALARPALAITREGSQFAIRISVRGGDEGVRYRVLRSGREIASGNLGADGTATDLVPKPDGPASFRVSVSAGNAQPATASIVLRS
jgi:hypothetical protein